MPSTNLPTDRKAVTARAIVTDLDHAQVIDDPDRGVVAIHLRGAAGEVVIEGSLGDVYAQVIEVDRQLARLVRPTS